MGLSNGDFPGSKIGVCGRLGILKCRGEDEVAGTGVWAPVERYAELFVRLKLKFFPLGGDCGGSIITEGAMVDMGRCRGRVGEGDGFAETFRRGGCNPLRSVVSCALPLAARNPSAPKAAHSSPTVTGFVGFSVTTKLCVGFGETALGAVGFGLEFAICSKCERREETGF